jgi:steroid delta-isomerase
MTRTPDPAELAARHVAAFNQAVLAHNFGAFLAGFADDAVIRFENVPGAGILEFAGRAAYAAAYAEQPPDDQIEIAGQVSEAGPETVIPFAWLRDGARGTIRLVSSAGLVGRMTVRFD